MVITKFIGPGGKIPVIIRDDDTNFFTKSEMLESIYSKAWKAGFKVCLSTVPLVRGINDISVPPDFRKSSLYYSIAENESLLRYLRQKIHKEGVVEILQHGYSHDYSKEPNRWEFGSDLKESSKIKYEIQQGRTILHQAFNCEPKFFVPPGEDLTQRNLKIIMESGLTPIYRQTVLDTIIRSTLIPNLAKQIVFKQLTESYKKAIVENQFSWVSFMKPVILALKNNAITWSTSSFNLSPLTLKSLVDLGDHIPRSGTLDRVPICMLNHYHLYYYDWNSTITKHELLRTWAKILDCFTESWKVTFSELYERMQKIQNVNIVRTGSKITLVSKFELQDFSLRVEHPLESNENVIRDDETNLTTINHISPNDIIVLYEKK